MYKNFSSHEPVIFEIPNFQDQSGVEFDLENLQPCMSYRYELWTQGSNSELIHSQDFKTEFEEGKNIGLNQHEVILWSAEDDYEVVSVEWADRCIENYKLGTTNYLKICV